MTSGVCPSYFQSQCLLIWLTEKQMQSSMVYRYVGGTVVTGMYLGGLRVQTPTPEMKDLLL